MKSGIFGLQQRGKLTDSDSRLVGKILPMLLLHTSSKSFSKTMMK